MQRKEVFPYAGALCLISRGQRLPRCEYNRATSSERRAPSHASSRVSTALLPHRVRPRWTEAPGAAHRGGERVRRMGGGHPAGQVRTCTWRRAHSPVSFSKSTDTCVKNTRVKVKALSPSPSALEQGLQSPDCSWVKFREYFPKETNKLNY